MAFLWHSGADIAFFEKIHLCLKIFALIHGSLFIHWCIDPVIQVYSLRLEMKISYDYILIYPYRNLSLSIHAQKLIALNILLVKFQGNFLILTLKISYLKFPYVAIFIAQTAPILGLLLFFTIGYYKVYQDCVKI